MTNVCSNPSNQIGFILFLATALIHSFSASVYFHCFLYCSPPDETDGPPGAIAMASMLLSLGKKVTIITDRRAMNLNTDLINECVKSGKKFTLYICTYLCMSRFYLSSRCYKFWCHSWHCIFYYQVHARYQTRFAAVNICKSHAIPQSSRMFFAFS